MVLFAFVFEPFSGSGPPIMMCSKHRNCINLKILCFDMLFCCHLLLGSHVVDLLLGNFFFVLKFFFGMLFCLISLFGLLLFVNFTFSPSGPRIPGVFVCFYCFLCFFFPLPNGAVDTCCFSLIVFKICPSGQVIAFHVHVFY